MEKPLDTKESLEIITRMIHQSQKNVQQTSFHLLLWGWVTTLAYLSQYILLVYFEYPDAHMIWLISIPTGIVSGIYGYRTGTNAKVTTHLDYVYTQVWLGFLVPFLCVLFFAPKFGHEFITGMILMLAGSAVFISSRVLKHTPTMLGSFVLWAMAILALQISDESQYLFGAVGTFIGYLMPGYLLKQKEKNG